MSDPSTKHKLTYRTFDKPSQYLLVFISSLAAIVTDENFEKLTKTLHDLYNKYFPSVTKFWSARLNKPWLTHDILNFIKYKSKLFKMYELGIADNKTYT